MPTGDAVADTRTPAVSRDALPACTSRRSFNALRAANPSSRAASASVLLNGTAAASARSSAAGERARLGHSIVRRRPGKQCLPLLVAVLGGQAAVRAPLGAVHGPTICIRPPSACSTVFAPRSAAR